MSEFLGFAAIIILFLILLYFIIKSIYNHFNKEEDKDFNSDLSVVGYYFLTIAFLFLIFSFVSPFLFTRLSATKDFDFSNTGEIGDTLGGIMTDKELLEKVKKDKELIYLEKC